ncbi:unnamed protein product [Rotaria socialis]|uniref:ZZ-type domain-containing protein n=1 Tax=Rotaria socialis TaxID=392032 RepID=A0A818FGL0_9BILA|nr:unnamed protein product [Rotaria socialis]CAF4617926.1 unnamed protein product [Rotaria socialis]
MVLALALHAVGLLGTALLKGVGVAAGKHAYDKIVTNKKSRQYDKEIQQQSSLNSRDSSNYIYRDAYCDGCGKSISDGNRYYCQECPNFDLCENCNHLPYIVTRKGVHYKNHRMLKIIQSDNIAFTSPRNDSASNYSFAYCDVCGYSIVDSRYKCLQCPDFDLCQRCYYLPPFYASIKGHTTYHNMIEMIQ